MAELDIGPIEARHAAATEGPWALDSKSGYDDTIRTIVANAEGSQVEVVQEPTDFYNYPSGSFLTTDGLDANLVFIQNSWRDVADLIAEVKRLRGLVGHG